MAAAPPPSPSPAVIVPGTGQLQCTLFTEIGPIVARLHEARAPRTVHNFVGLATGHIGWRDPKKGLREGVPFYDGLCFHRTVRNFVIQLGEPASRYEDLVDQWGKGTPGYTFADEFHPELRHQRPGTLSMANNGRADTNGCQFFITEVPAPHLDDRHSVFGLVTSGLDLVSAIASGKVGDKHRPLDPIFVERVEIFRL
ncbi:MAG: peptidylprolyl isomerase [Myxococcota bacterium]